MVLRRLIRPKAISWRCVRRPEWHHALLAPLLSFCLVNKGSVAAYYAKNDIRVNVIAPGLVETPMALRAAGDESILSFIKNKQPLDGGRIGKPEDLDGLAVYFMSDDSRFTTGQVIAVDGGWSITEGK